MRTVKVKRHLAMRIEDQFYGKVRCTLPDAVWSEVLVPSLNNLHFAETVQALMEELEGIGQQILLGYTNYSAEREEQIVETMLRLRPEALVLSYDGLSDRTSWLLGDANIPVVELLGAPQRADVTGHAC